MARLPEDTGARRVVFLTRDPVVHQQGGSTTYALGLLQLLRAQGADVTLVATTAYSRSPRLFFRAVVPSAGVRLVFPGYLRLGNLYVSPFRAKSWARLLTRIASRRLWLQPLQTLLQKTYGDRLFAGAWDLSPPTTEESKQARLAVQAERAETIVANYCFWGPWLAAQRGRERQPAGGQRTAILMHDLLSVRVQRFREAGLPLDCPPISEAEEMDWLSGADTVLASQEREAETIRTRVSARVLVTPMALQPRALPPAKVVEGRCLFVGSNILPNQTGLRFLLESVWPQVRAAVPGATLAIAGTVGQVLAQGEETLQAMGVLRLGKVPSLEGEYARAAVCLVPLLLGTGIKIKLVEALGFGKAIVSTTVGVQGLEAWAAEAVEIADEPGPYAAAIVQLLQQAPLRGAREDAALRLADVHFGAGRPLDPEFVEALL